MSKVFVLRTCNVDMTSYRGFKWPESGEVSCDDWDPKPECGNGLHGLLRGEGDGSLLNWNPDAKWLVVEVEESEIVDIGDKVKFPKGNVIHCGDRKSATDFLQANGCHGPIVGAFVTVGDKSVAVAGYRGTATAGNYGTATAGYGGTATAGIGGTATAGNDGTATAGNCGTAAAGDDGTATAGDRGILNFRWWDQKAERYRIATFYVGEDGIEPNIKYRCMNGKAVKVE